MKLWMREGEMRDRLGYILVMVVLLFSLAGCAGSKGGAPGGVGMIASGGEAQHQDRWRQSVTTDARRMGDAFRDGDEDLFISYLYPGLLEQLGGVEGAREMIRGIEREVEEAGGEILGWSVEEPRGDFVEYEGEIQVVLRSFMEMEIEGHTVHDFHDLIGISQDGGRRWYFITAGEGQVGVLRDILPNISPDLELRSRKMELFTEDGEVL